MEKRIERLLEAVNAALGKRVVVLKEALGELLLEVKPADYREAAQILRDSPSLKFEQLIDFVRCRLFPGPRRSVDRASLCDGVAVALNHEQLANSPAHVCRG